MLKVIKKIVKRSPFYIVLRRCLEISKQAREVRAWERNGSPAPPPHIIKQQTLLEYSRRYGLKVLVETGTFQGDMVEAMRTKFERIFSIELSNDLYEKARIKFAAYKHIEIIHGDSAAQLVKVLAQLERPALFWLDGHYSAGITARGAKDTPIMEELQHILDAENGGHVMIIDDARCFGTNPAYPTIEQVKCFIRSKRKDVEIIIRHDSIRVAPKG